MDHKNRKVYLAFKDRPDEEIVPKKGTIVPDLGTPDDELNYPPQIRHRIQAGAACSSYIHRGWFDIVCKLDDELTKLYPFYVVDQIKEKFGSLRYYTSGFPQDFPMGKVYELVDNAMDESTKTCEICGEVGKTMMVEQCYLTRCEKHKDSI